MIMMTFSRYLIAGALNTGLTYVLYLGLLFLMPYIWAYSLTYVAGIALGYALNVRWVFNKAPNFRTATAYPLTYGLNYILGVAMLWLFVEIIKLPKELAPLIVVALSVPITYFFAKAIFKGKLNHDAKTNCQ